MTMTTSILRMKLDASDFTENLANLVEAAPIPASSMAAAACVPLGRE